MVVSLRSYFCEFHGAMDVSRKETSQKYSSLKKISIHVRNLKIYDVMSNFVLLNKNSILFFKRKVNLGFQNSYPHCNHKIGNRASFSYSSSMLKSLSYQLNQDFSF